MRAHDTHQGIIKDGDGLPRFTRASQNIATMAAPLWRLSEPATPEEHQAQREIRSLLEHAAVQQAESSASQWCNASWHASSMHHHDDASAHRPPHDR
jgi:hypothetical protein